MGCAIPFFCAALFGRFRRGTGAARALLGRFGFTVIVGATDGGRQHGQVEAFVCLFGFGHDLARATTAGTRRFGFGLRRGGLFNDGLRRGGGLLYRGLRFGSDGAIAPWTVATGIAVLARFVLAAMLVARGAVAKLAGGAVGLIALRTVALVALSPIGIIALGPIALLTRGTVIAVIAIVTVILFARGAIIAGLFARRAVVGRIVGAEFVDAVGDALEIIAILVEILVRVTLALGLALLLLFLPGAVVGQDTEIMISELEIIFGVDPITRHLGIARHILVFFKKLGRIATGAIVDAVAAVTTPAPIVGVGTSVIIPAAIAATGLPVVDQDMILVFAVITLAENTVPSPSLSATRSSGRI